MAMKRAISRNFGEIRQINHRKGQRQGMVQGIRGFIQHYAWGGRYFIPRLLALGDEDSRPFAELWFGDHVAGPSGLSGKAEEHGDLRRYIDRRPAELLGPAICQEYNGRLPFLLKILDVAKMLSIQAHPSREAAIRGFDRENSQGIPLKAPHRIFRDPNPKPEMMVALSSFWLLHGFLPPEEAARNLEAIPSLREYGTMMRTLGIRETYKHWMTLPIAAVNARLMPLQKILMAGNPDEYPRSRPDFWARRAFETFPGSDGHLDRGIFSIYIMHIVALRPGEAIFQDAGMLHAYLEGTNVELMISSDNVFRGGLTDKHMDIPLLLDHLDFRPTIPKIVQPLPAEGGGTTYPIPSAGFWLQRHQSSKEEILSLAPVEGPTLLLCLEGKLETLDQPTICLSQGEALFIPHHSPLAIRQAGDIQADLFRAGATRVAHASENHFSRKSFP